MLNYYDLGCMQVGLKSFKISVDYQVYMGSSLRIWSFRRLFLYLCSYKLVGSVTIPRTRTWSSNSVRKSGKEQVSSHFIIPTTDKCYCVVGSNSCSAGLEAKVIHLREENSRVVGECDRLNKDNRKLAQDQSQLRDHTTKMTDELKGKLSNHLCSFLLPTVVWRGLPS